jgi:alkaline phosphatase D
MDTRRYRLRGDDITTSTMLGDAQLAALHTWLSRVNETSTFKFIVSSVPFTSLWMRDAQYDSWAGFPAEKAGLLEAFHSVPNLMILSGDRHEFAAIEFNSASPDHHTVREFSTSPLSMFYAPFVRTLRMQSDALVTQKHTNATATSVNNTEEVVTTYEDVPQERVLKYLPLGNFKW